MYLEIVVVLEELRFEEGGVIESERCRGGAREGRRQGVMNSTINSLLLCSTSLYLFSISIILLLHVADCSPACSVPSAYIPALRYAHLVLLRPEHTLQHDGILQPHLQHVPGHRDAGESFKALPWIWRLRSFHKTAGPNTATLGSWGLSLNSSLTELATVHDEGTRDHVTCSSHPRHGTPLVDASHCRVWGRVLCPRLTISQKVIGPYGTFSTGKDLEEKERFCQSSSDRNDLHFC